MAAVQAHFRRLFDRDGQRSLRTCAIAEEEVFGVGVASTDVVSEGDWRGS